MRERTVGDLIGQLSEKHHIDPTHISSIIHLNDKGMRVMVDDDVVRELPEGQDMIIDISEARGHNGSANGLAGSLMELTLNY